MKEDMKMKLTSEASLLRVFIGESDKLDGRPLYKVIVEEARKRGIAGATVLRGFLGFGANSRIHTSKVLRLSEDLPVVVEIVDTEDKIEAFLPELDKMMGKMMGEGLVTLEKVRVITYRHNSKV
jgi:PII-like signaling protein